MTINISEYTYAKLMELALSFVEDYEEENNITVDKRQGSIIYDALAPFCQVLANVFLDLYNFNSQLYVTTATGENLDKRVADIGLERIHATNAIVFGEFKDSFDNHIDVPIESRFSTISETNPVIYTVKERWGRLTGFFKLECNTPGSIGNNYTGPITPLEDILGLASAEIIGINVFGKDEETDEQLRSRYLEIVKSKPFGGNIADYRNKLLNDVGGIGGVQVYPVYNGGGTVKVSIVDSTFSPCSESLLTQVQNLLDPEETNEVNMDALAQWTVGTLASASGANTGGYATTRIKTNNYINMINITKITCSGNYVYQIFVYNEANTEEGSYIGILQNDNTLQKYTNFFSTPTYISNIPNGNYIKIVMKEQDSGDISVENSENLHLSKTFSTQGTGLGLAPIGHTVTVVTPNEVTVNISATLTLKSDLTISDVEASIEEHLENYIQSLRENWGNSDNLNNYICIVDISQIIYNIMNVYGVLSVSNVEINGSSNNLYLTETSTVQQLPVLGSVTLSV